MNLISVLLILFLVFPACSETTLYTTTVTEVFDFENDGTADKDASHDLTEVNTPTYQSSAPKQGTYNVFLDNTTNEHFTLADDDDFDPDVSTDYSIALWYQTAATYPAIFWKWTGQDGYIIRLQGADGLRVIVYHANNWSTGSATSGTALATGTWYHIVIAFDQDATNEITLWVSETTFGDTINAEAINLDVDPRNNTATLYIGTQGGTTHSRNKYYDELAWFKGHAVSAAEAEEIFDGTASGGWREAGGGGPTGAQVILARVG